MDGCNTNDDVIRDAICIYERWCNMEYKWIDESR